MQRIVKRIKDELPKFNDALLIDLRKNEISNLMEFIAERYRECADLADKNLVLINYEVLSPLARLNHELSVPIKKNQVNIRNEEAVLVEYNFKYYDRLFTIPLYIPYLYENSTMVIGGTNYESLLNMSEKLFSVLSDSSGIIIKVIRQPIQCWRNTLHAFSDSVTGENFVGNIVTCKIHYRKDQKSKKIRPTIIHYLLCKFTLPEVLMRFGIDPDAAKFCELEEFEDGYFYFKTKNVVSGKEQIFLKVRREAMIVGGNRMLHDIVSAIVYLMNGYRFIQFQELVDDSKMVFIILLGRLIYTNGLNRIHAISYMMKHLESVDSYLDGYTKQIYHYNGIDIEDIYDLLCYVLINISEIIVSFPNNNMYNKRLETINNTIIESLVSALYHRVYKYERKPDIDHMTKAMIGALRVPPRFVLKSLGANDRTRFNPQIYSDNWLLTVGDKVVKRLSALPKASSKKDASKSHGSGINSRANRFHPSMMSIESPIGFSSNPGQNCLVNPYAKIDASGGFVQDEKTALADAELNFKPTDDFQS